MPVDLIKRGQTIDLTKGRAGLKNITIGLSWGSKATQKDEKSGGGGKGLLARMFDRAVERTQQVASGGMDIDSSVIMLDGNDRAVDTVYYGKQTSNCGSIYHAGDDRTGNDKYGAHDNEEITIDLSRIPSAVQKLVFVANVYQGNSKDQHFGQVKGAYIRVLNSEGREEFIRYNLAEDYNKMCGLVVGELYRYSGEWKFRAVGQGTSDDSLSNLQRMVTR